MLKFIVDLSRGLAFFLLIALLGCSVMALPALMMHGPLLYVLVYVAMMFGSLWWAVPLLNEQEQAHGQG